MKKNIALVLSCAIAVFGLASCNKETDQPATNGKKHTVIFQAHNPAASETKTALHLQVIPDWRNTDPEDVHIFETETTSGGSYRMEASKVYMDINEDYTDARFTAEFDNATVIVNPPTTKASSSEFKYTAIMATRDGDKYIVPSVQYPDEESWIDPKADVLVGRTDNTYSATLHEKEIQDLNFRRPVALARLAITNLEGSTVTKVKITTANHITGYVTYDQVNFDKKTIEEFDGDDSNKELTILYPAGKNRTTTFYAYFVSVPGAIQFSKIEVYTDKYVFTKTYANPVSISLPAGEFINLPMDMTVKEGGNVTRTGLNQQTLTFVDANQQEVTEPIEYDLNLSVNPDGKDGFVAPTLVIGDDVVDPTSVTIASNNEEVATVDAEGKASLTGATGEATITATVPGDETHADGYASYKIIVKDTTAPVVVASVYTLVTKQDDVVEGKYLIVSASDAYIFDGTGTYQGGYTTIADAEDISIEDNKITINSETAAYDFAFAKSGNGFTITGAKGMIVAAAHSGASTSEETYITFAETGGNVFLQRGNVENKPEALLFSTTRGTSSNEYLYYHTTNKIFKIGGSGNTNGIHLYFAGERAEQTIAYSDKEVSYDMASESAYVGPTLSGDPKTTVAYSSSDTSVATVDANGAVTIVGKGETTITATALASSEYLSATASYTLTVTNTASKDLVFNKVTSNDDIENDAQYILVYETSSKAFKPILASSGTIFTKSTANAIDVTINNNTISSADLNDCLITFEEGKYLWIESAGKYLYSGASGDNALGAEDKNTSHTISITVDSNGIATIGHSDDTKYHLYWSSSKYFSGIYQSGNTSSSSYDANICIYKLDDGRQTPTMSFSPDTAEIDLADVSSFTKPALTYTGDATSITYTSSNTAVAEVSNDGTITPKKKGTVTITAKAARTDTYKAASASYTLNVNNSEEVASVYNKVTSTAQLTPGSKVIIVYEGSDNYNPAVFVPTLSGNYFTQKDKSNAKQNVTITNNSITSSDLDDCQMTVSEGYYFYVSSVSRYLYPTYNNIGAEEEKSSSHAVTVTITDGVAKLSRVSSNTTYFIRYSGSNLYFENTSSNSANVALYKLEGSGGTTPEPPTPSTTTTYTQISTYEELESGTYIIVSASRNWVYKGTGSGNNYKESVSSTSGDFSRSSDKKTITISGDSAADYEFVVTRTGDVVTLQNTQKGYIYWNRSSSSGNYISVGTSIPSGNTYNSEFTINKTYDTTASGYASDPDVVFLYVENGTDKEYLYSKDSQNEFKIGGSGAPAKSTGGVLLYKKN